MTPDRLHDLPLFLAVARHGSFAAAGAEIGLTRSAVGLAVRRLEDRLGVVLFARTTSSVGLTEAGRSFWRRRSRSSGH